MDCNYKVRIDERRRIMANHPATVMGALPEGHSAVQELYSFLLGDYLPSRYPTMFSLSEDGKTFRNLVTKSTFPSLPPNDPIEALRAIGETVEDDLFLLRQTDDGHKTVAFLCCFPAGFDPSKKLGKLLKDVHEPVPAYNKIGPSMERFFGKLEVGKSVKRVNVRTGRSPPG